MLLSDRRTKVTVSAVNVAVSRAKVVDSFVRLTDSYALLRFPLCLISLSLA